jgi:membrane fusion protein, multidrug efflux system
MSRADTQVTPGPASGGALHAVSPVDRVPATGRRGKRAFIVLGALAAVVLGGIGGYAWFTAGQESTDDAVVEADVVALTARVGGAVARVVVHDNQPVRTGDLLLQLDDADFAAKLAQARAELDTATAQAAGADAQRRVIEAGARGGFHSAQAQVSTSSSGVQAAEAQIAAAEAALTRAAAESQKAGVDLARARELIATDAIPRQQLDNAQLASDSAQAALAQAAANLRNAQQSKRSAESRVEEAEGRLFQMAPVDAEIATARAAGDLAHARVAAIQAAVRLAELQLSYTKVVAPQDGVVTQLSAREGGQVQSGQPLAQLVPRSTYVVANFKETQVGAMRPGDRAEVRIDAYEGTKLEGVVESLSSGTGARFSLMPPDNASGNFIKVVQRVPVRLVWKTAPDIPLKAGLSAYVTVFVGQGKD